VRSEAHPKSAAETVLSHSLLARVSHVRDPLGFYIFPLANIAAFAVLIVFACRVRFD
jgi:hypothetical protein